ncbi:Imm1 family immunity protein [Kitasatospora sp. NPDC094019]|uniref:Imm1 family immunity protein n=1 Tax=Kitasatospora sp. NPDC094019 TaxID=3364091 RepID=UPI0037F18C78
MILRVSHPSRPAYTPSGTVELAEAVDIAIKSLEPRRNFDDGTFFPGSMASFAFFAERENVADCRLYLSANQSLGYGAIVWEVDGNSERCRSGGIYTSTWISDNPTPPDFDPKLVADTGYPRYHAPESALPLEMIRSAVLEFCESPTGERPSCIQWTEGFSDGQRFDQGALDEEELSDGLPGWLVEIQRMKDEGII